MVSIKNILQMAVIRLISVHKTELGTNKILSGDSILLVPNSVLCRSTVKKK